MYMNLAVTHTALERSGDGGGGAQDRRRVLGRVIANQ